MKTTRPKRHALTALLAFTLVGLTACSGEEQSTTEPTGESLPDALFLSEAPTGAKPITELKASAKEGDEVVVRVIVGGSVSPIVAGRASTAIIDAALPNACVGEDDHCETPWDYCCTPPEERTANMATLQITDEAGKVLKADLSTRIKPLTTLVVKGTVGPRPDTQVLTVDAQGIYIETETN